MDLKKFTVVFEIWVVGLCKQITSGVVGCGVVGLGSLAIQSLSVITIIIPYSDSVQRDSGWRQTGSSHHVNHLWGRMPMDPHQFTAFQCIDYAGIII